jgi:hypothetical protein
LTGTLKDGEFDSNDEIVEAVPSAWSGLTFDDAQSIFHNWMSRFASVIQKGEEYTFEEI